jgi:monooxygenase
VCRTWLHLRLHQCQWTLKADLTARWTCRLLQHLDRNGQAVAVAPRDPAVAEAPFLALSSGYVQRALELLPRQGTQAPWSVHQNYLADLRAHWHSPRPSRR